MLPFAIFLFCAIGIVAGLVWLQVYDQSGEQTEKGTKNYLPIVIGSILLCLLTAAFVIFFKPGSKDDVWQEYKSLRTSIDNDIDEWSAYDYEGIDSLINDKMKMLREIDKNITFINSKSIVDNDFEEVKKELRTFQEHRYFQAEQLMALMRKNTFGNDSRVKDMDMIISDLEDEITNLEGVAEEERQKVIQEQKKVKVSTNRGQNNAQGFRQQLTDMRNTLEEKDSEIADLKLNFERVRKDNTQVARLLEEERKKSAQMMAEISRLHLKLNTVNQLETELFHLRQEKKRLEQLLARYSNVVPASKNNVVAKP